MVRSTKDAPLTATVSPRRVAESFGGAPLGEHGTQRLEEAQAMGHGRDTLMSGEAGTDGRVHPGSSGPIHGVPRSICWCGNKFKPCRSEAKSHSVVRSPRSGVGDKLVVSGRRDYIRIELPY